MAYTHLAPGRELEISAHIYFSSAQADISELVKLSPEQLKARQPRSRNRNPNPKRKVIPGCSCWCWALR